MRNLARFTRPNSEAADWTAAQNKISRPGGGVT